MLVALHGVKLHAQCLHGVMIYAYTYSWSEALCLMLFRGVSYMFIAMHGVKL